MGAGRSDPPAMKFRQLDIYYMNVDPKKSSSSARRRDVQECHNPNVAAQAGYSLVPHRVNAVTPDSDAWSVAQACFGSQAMTGSGKDDGVVASCIVLSFREALRQALRDLETAQDAKLRYIMVAEDDMVLVPGFSPILDQAMWELSKAPPAMGAALHSDSLKLNGLDVDSGHRVLFEDWPRYPTDIEVSPFRTVWPGELVIPDQPVALLLKVSRLQEFAELFDRRLQESWAPLDWLLANAPFGGSGALRLALRNGFCRTGAGSPGDLSTGSDRIEQHRVAAGGELEEPRPARASWGRPAAANFQAPPSVYVLEDVGWWPPARPPKVRPVPKGSKPGRKWMVVAGERSKGLVVRSGALLASFAYRHRLEAGAWVEELERSGDRLHYKRLHGDGPDWGWVSLHNKGKQLLTVEDPRGNVDP